MHEPVLKDPPPQPAPRYILPLLLLIMALALASPFVVSRYRIAKISENEAAVVQAMRDYAAAQERYFKRKLAPGEAAEYAQKLELLELNTPLPPLTGSADFHGYRFAILTAQDNTVPSGAMSYLDEHGRMTKGFGLLAVPVRYGMSGRNTYLLSGTRIHYIDLGLRTTQVTQGLREFSIPDRAGQIQ